MSANTTIQEGGKGYPFGPVKCLMVEGDNGEFFPWYPEADRALDSLSVTQNGIYRASDRGVYGWNRVSVNVAQSDRVTGKDPETGEEKTVTVDPQTGELVETVVPTEIRVTTLPTKTDYTEGETIDYSGIVVHAYSSTGQDMGAVPFGELVFPVTTAQGGDEWTDEQGLNAEKIIYLPAPSVQGIEYVSRPLGTRYGNPAAYGSGHAPGQYLMTRYAGNNYGLVITGDGNTNGYYQDLIGEDLLWILFSGMSIAADQKFHFMGVGDILTDLRESTKDPSGTSLSNLHATQSLPVQWQDPDSGAVLETSFTINVTGGE